MSQDETHVCIYKAGSAIEANLVKGLLTGEGIEVLLRGEMLTGVIGELPPTDVSVDVYVFKEKEAQAQVFVEQYRANQQSTADSVCDWTCANCGEANTAQFEVCWQCQREPNE